MYLWLLIVAVLIVQDFTSTSVVLYLAYQNQYPFWIIHAIWLAATLFDIYVGYALGNMIHGSSKHVSFVRRMDERANAFKTKLGEDGENAFIITLGFVNFAYLNGFIASWLGLPWKRTLIFTAIGDACWYLLALSTVFGVSILTPHRWISFFLVLALAAALAIYFRLFRKRRSR